MSEPRFVASAAPIYFVGDSHVAIFDDLLYQRGDTYVVTHAGYVRGLSAASFSVDSVVSPAVLDMLAALGVLARRDGDTTEMAATTDHPIRYERLLRGRAVDDIGFVFSCGDLDARAVMRDIGPDASFELPFAAGERVEGREPVPYALLENRARASLTPLFRGLETLRALGLHKLAVPSLPPPMSDERSDEYFRPGLPEALRYAVVRVFNESMRSMSRDAGLRFVDVWPMVTRDGRADPAFYLDGVHLNRGAADALVRAVLAD